MKHTAEQGPPHCAGCMCAVPCPQTSTYGGSMMVQEMFRFWWRTRDSAVLTAQWLNMLLLHFKLPHPEPFETEDLVIESADSGLQSGKTLGDSFGGDFQSSWCCTPTWLVCKRTCIGHCFGGREVWHSAIGDSCYCSGRFCASASNKHSSIRNAHEDWALLWAAGKCASRGARRIWASRCKRGSSFRCLLLATRPDVRERGF